MKLNRRAAVAGAIACAVAPALPAPAIGGVATFDPRSVFAGLTPIARRMGFEPSTTDYWVGQWEEAWRVPTGEPTITTSDDGPSFLRVVARYRLNVLYLPDIVPVEQAAYAARDILAANGASHVQMTMFNYADGHCDSFYVNGFSYGAQKPLTSHIRNDQMAPLLERPGPLGDDAFGNLFVEAEAIPDAPIRLTVKALVENTHLDEFFRANDRSIVLCRRSTKEGHNA